MIYKLIISASLFISTFVLATSTSVPQPVPAVFTPTSIRFQTIDLYADSEDEPLAAYQIEVIAEFPSGSVSLVGVEGGDHAATKGAFAQPPVYDPDALTHSRIILAAYTSCDAANLPIGRVRIARLHVQIESTAGNAANPANDLNQERKNITNPTYRVRVIAAGRADGTRITADFEALPGEHR